MGMSTYGLRRILGLFEFGLIARVGGSFADFKPRRIYLGASPHYPHPTRVGPWLNRRLAGVPPLWSLLDETEHVATPDLVAVSADISLLARVWRC